MRNPDRPDIPRTRILPVLLTGFLLNAPVSLPAQRILAPGADLQSTVMELDTSSRDSLVEVFIYNSPETENPASLSLRAEDISQAVFEWSAFDTANEVFVVYQTDSLASFSVTGDLLPGCYRVHISSTTTDTLLTAWVFRNTPVVSVRKNAEGKTDIYQASCEKLDLEGRADADTLTYYDFSADSNNMKTIPNGMNFEWTDDDEEHEIFNPTGDLRPRMSIEPGVARRYWPPTKDTRFTLTATDSFGLTLDDQVLYESIHTKADFSVYLDDGEGSWTQEDNPAGEAPLEVKFVNNSENGVEYYWTFIDSAKTGAVEGDTTFSEMDTAYFTYYIPEYYYPFMVSMSDAGCTDTIKQETPIIVENSDLKVPNVFSPNSNGSNDYFKIYSKSLKEFRITIFNRWGDMVYQYEQTSDKFEWEGWDGTLHGKGRNLCEPGIYYYVIEAIGWDNVKYRKGPYRGFFYLYR